MALWDFVLVYLAVATVVGIGLWVTMEVLEWLDWRRSSSGRRSGRR